MTFDELKEKAHGLPLKPGVYIMQNAKNEVIYVGKAKALKNRVSQYFANLASHTEKTRAMVSQIDHFDVIIADSEFEALILECSLIKRHQPKYNILLKDDKGYSYVKITRGDYPRISAALQKDDDEADYIGPFTSSFAVRQMVETAQDSFLLPRCNRRFPEDIGKGRPCLNAHIGKCMALCSGKISKEVYNEAVKGAIQLIRHGKKDILTTMRRRMEEAAERLDFEQAALLRDQIAAVEKVSAGQKVVVDETVEMDVMSFAASGTSSCAAILRYRKGRLADKREFVFKGSTDLEALREEFLPRYYLYGGEIPRRVAVDALPEAAEALEQLLSETRGAKVQLYVPQRGDVAQLVTMAYTNAVERLARESGRTDRGQRLLDETAALLGLAKPPHVIESYDISNWGDGTSVCGMVVFQDGKPLKSGYRRFKMRTVLGTDDFASMAEALSRRAGEYEKGTAGQFGVLPDLILLDGGKGQVSAVKAALAGTALAAVPLFGMVKDDRHRTRAIVTADGGEIAVSMHRGVFTFLANIQEEVHRFSIEYQRASQKKKSYASSLTAIPGVGPATAKALLTQFKTVGAVREASVEELEQAKGVGSAAARRIFDWFHGGPALDKDPGTGDNEP